MASPIFKKTNMQNTIASITLKVPLICSKTFTIFLSAKGWATADKTLYNTVKTSNFVIGVIHIPIITIIPTIPTPFFITDVAPQYCFYRIS